ncbi:RCC1 domain-containing protein 1 [Chamberlinius hualienensis]
MILYYCGFNGFNQVPNKYTDDEPFIDIDLPVKDLSKISISWTTISYVDVENNLRLTGFNSTNPSPNLKVKEAAIASKHLAAITEDGFGKIYDLNNNTLIEIKQLELQKGKLIACATSDCDTLFINDAGKVVWVSLKDKMEELLLPLAWRITQVSCGKEHMLLLNENGVVYSFGQGSRGQLGHGDIESESSPRVIECLEGIVVKQIAAGGWHSAALTNSGDLYTWGWNESGQLGRPITRNVQIHRVIEYDHSKFSVQPLPKCVELDDVIIEKVSCGGRHTLAVTKNGKMCAFGWNRYGQLGIRCSDEEVYDKPTIISGTGARIRTFDGLLCGSWGTIVHCKPID